MNRLLLPCVLAWTLPASAGAQRLVPSFDSIRAVQRGSSAARIVPVDYRTEYPDFFSRPRGGNLSPERIAALWDQLQRLQGGEFGGAGLLNALKRNTLRSRLFNRLNQMDNEFADTIAPERWNEILDGMEEIARDEIQGGPIDEHAVIDKMLKSAAQGLRDPLTRYFDPAENKERREGRKDNYSGIGAMVKKHDDGVLLDIIYPDSPAERAGLKGGDVVTHVDGVPVAGMKLDEAVLRIKGVTGSGVSLTIQRTGTPTKSVIVTRGRISQKLLYYKMLTPEIGYLYLSGFRPGSHRKVFAAIRALQSRGMTKLVFDLRHNPGGSVNAVSAMTSEFLKDGDEIVSFRTQGSVESRNVTVGDGEFSDLRVVLLINSGSASASEILSGALQDHIAEPVVIGSRSYGKGTRQATYGAYAGRALRITNGRWYTPDGRAIDAKRGKDGERLPGTGGIVPDLEVKVSAEQESKIISEIIRELHGGQLTGPRTADPALEKALAVLENRAGV